MEKRREKRRELGNEKVVGKRGQVVRRLRETRRAGFKMKGKALNTKRKKI